MVMSQTIAMATISLHGLHRLWKFWFKHICVFFLAILKVENSKGAFSHFQMAFHCFVSKKMSWKKSQKTSWHQRDFKCKMKLPPARNSTCEFNFSVLLKILCQKTPPGSHWVSVRLGWRKVSDYRHPPMTDFNSQSDWPTVICQHWQPIKISASFDGWF